MAPAGLPTVRKGYGVLPGIRESGYSIWSVRPLEPGWRFGRYRAVACLDVVDIWQQRLAGPPAMPRPVTTSSFGN